MSSPLMDIPGFIAGSFNKAASSYATNYTMEHPWYFADRVQLIPGVADVKLGLYLPIITYWVVSLIYHALDTSGWKWIEKYRIQPAEDADKKNLASRTEVIRTVLKMQLITGSLGALWQIIDEGARVEVIQKTNHVLGVQAWGTFIAKWLATVAGDGIASQVMASYGSQLSYYMYWWVVPVWHVLFGAFVLDTVQYFIHRGFHVIPFLYKHVHSVHHRIYVPYAYGAQYNHPLEGGLADAFSGIVAIYLARMTEREAVLLLVFTTYKSVEDHCGYQWTWHPLRFLSNNDAEFHEIHHQVAGLKANFSQPHFVFWDKLLGTYMSREELEKIKAARKMKSQ